MCENELLVYNMYQWAGLCFHIERQLLKKFSSYVYWTRPTFERNLFIVFERYVFSNENIWR